MEQERCDSCGKWVVSATLFYNEDNDQAECEVCTFE